MLFFSKKVNKVINAKSLQVPCNLPFLIRDELILLKKRALPFISAEKLTAGMTVEAALVLPFFIFFAMALLSPLYWLDRQRKVQVTTEYFCEKLSQYSYLKECWKNENADEIFGIEVEEFSDTAAKLWLSGKIGKVVDDVRIKISDVPDKNGNICFEAEYREKIPYFSAIKTKIYVQAAAKRRCWIGLKGKLKAGNGETSGMAEDEIVYVGAGMGRYHLDRSCHYISNEYESVRVNQLNEKHIKPCAVCATNCEGDDIVYITVSGTHYHKTKNCRTMISYVREVSLSDVRHLGACSYCSGKK